MKMRFMAFLVILLWLPSIGWALCPVQETTLFFVNGVNTEKKDAERSKKRIKLLLLRSGISAECISFDVAYNTNEFTLTADLLEAFLQITAEQEEDPSTLWKFLFRVQDVFLTPIASLYDSLVDSQFTSTNLLIESGEYVLGDQLSEHLDNYQAALEAGRRVILLGHSQGNLYVNEAWEAFIATERQHVRTIGVSTPSDHVGGGTEPYTTLYKDGLAATVFALLGSLPTNTPMDEECLEGSWYCHGFINAYLYGTIPREQILGHILAALPEEAPPSFTIMGDMYLYLDGTPIPYVPHFPHIVLVRPDGSMITPESASMPTPFISYSTTFTEACTGCYLASWFYYSPYRTNYGTTYPPLPDTGGAPAADFLLGDMYNVDLHHRAIGSIDDILSP